MPTAGESFDFAINIPNKSKRGLEFVEDKVNGIAKSIGTATRKGKRFVNDFINKSARMSKKKGGMYDPKNQKLFHDLGDSFDFARGRLSLFSRSTNGLNIGVSILHNRLLQIVTVGYLVYEAFEALSEASDRLVDSAKKGILAFGSFQNSLNAYKKFQADIISGKLRGDAEDFVNAAKELNMMGVKATDSLMKSANDLARVTGEATSDVVGRIQSFAQGDLAAFDDVFGKDVMRKRYAAFEGNQRALTQAIVKELQANKTIAKAAAEMPMTFKELGQQIKAGKDSFLQAVFGSTADPNSFAGQVMSSMNKLVEYFRSKAEAFKKIASFLGAMFSTLWQSITRVFNSTIRPVFDKFFNWVNKSLASYKDTVAGIILYIQLVTSEVIDFLKTYGKYILIAIGLLKAFGLAKRALEVGKIAYFSLIRYFRILRVGVWRSKKAMKSLAKSFISFKDTLHYSALVTKDFFSNFRSNIMKVIPRIMSMNAALLANPYALIAVAIIALIGYVVLLIKYWDEIRVAMQNVSDGAILLVTAFLPLVGIPMLLAKHWEKFKAIFFNIWAAIRNHVVIWFLELKYKFLQLGSFLSSLKIPNFFSNIQLPDWANQLLDSFKSIGSKITEWFNDLWKTVKPGWLTDVLNFFSKGTEKLATTSAEALERQQAKLKKDFGVKSTVKAVRGITAKDERESALKNIEAKKAKEKGEDEPVIKAELLKLQPTKSPILDNLPTGKTFADIGGSSSTQNVTNNNYVTINADGFTATEMTKLVKKVLSAQEMKDQLRNA